MTEIFSLLPFFSALAAFVLVQRSAPDEIMVESEKAGAVGALSRQLQAISGSGWTNVQTPVRQGFEAVEATAQGLAEQLAGSREDVRRLEARLVGMEDMVCIVFLVAAEPKSR